MCILSFVLHVSGISGGRALCLFFVDGNSVLTLYQHNFHKYIPLKAGDELLYLTRRAFPSAVVFGKPFIHHGRSRSERDIRQGSDSLETRCDVLIWGLWDRYIYAIIDIKLVDTDSDTYRFEPMKTLLDW